MLPKRYQNDSEIFEEFLDCSFCFDYARKISYFVYFIDDFKIMTK